MREAGELTAGEVEIEGCRQGVSSYGGAKEVTLWKCRISGCKREGVLAAGTFTNAATEAQRDGTMAHDLLDGEKRKNMTQAQVSRGSGVANGWMLSSDSRLIDSDFSQIVAAEADARGRKLGLGLDVTLLQCSIAGNGVFGVSADSGVRLTMQQCLLEKNDPYSVFIKGGSDAIIRACQISFTGGTSKSPWQGLSAKARQEGIHVGINYHGSISLIGNTFCGPDAGKLAIVEEASEITQVSYRL